MQLTTHSTVQSYLQRHHIESVAYRCKSGITAFLLVLSLGIYCVQLDFTVAEAHDVDEVSISYHVRIVIFQLKINEWILRYLNICVACLSF